MNYGGRVKLRDGTERCIYVPQGKDKAVFEVIPVEILKSDFVDPETVQVRIIETGEIIGIPLRRVKSHDFVADDDIIYQYIGTESELLFIRKEFLQDGSERVVYLPDDEEKSVFEVIPVKVLSENSELKMKKIQIKDTGKIDFVSSDSVKSFNHEKVIYKYLGKEQDILQSALHKESSGDIDDFEDSGENNGELRYNPDSGNCEYYPDRLGGMESEEEFWEH